MNETQALDHLASSAIVVTGEGYTFLFLLAIIGISVACFLGGFIVGRFNKGE